MNVYFIIFDLGIAFIFFLIGLGFYISNGKAANLLTGYNMKSIEERKKYDEKRMCKNYGKKMMLWAVPFLIGTAIDIKFSGYGVMIAWIIWTVMFILFLMQRNKIEK